MGVPTPSIRLTLLASFGLIALLGLIALVTTYASHEVVRDSHERTRNEALPFADATDELEIAALTLALSVTEYVEQGDSRALDDARRARTAYGRAAGVARRITRGDATRRMLAAADASFTSLRVLGEDMVDRRTRRDRRFGRIALRLDGLKDRLDEALAGRRPSRLTDVMLAMQIDISGLQGQLGGYLAGGDRNQRQEAQESIAELRDGLADLEARARGGTDRRVARDAAGLLAGMSAAATEVLRDEAVLRAEGGEFEARRSALIDLLDRGVQRLAANETRRDQARATAASTRARTIAALSLALLVLVATAAFLVLFRAVVAPVRRLIRSTREVAAGHLDHRVTGLRRDELGELGEHFNHMVARLERTTVSKARLERSEARLAEQATTDGLTGLANRVLLVDRLEQALRRRRRLGHGVAVLFLDLDGFKAVNDAHGHETGDAVLRAVAERLRFVLREEDTVARGASSVRPDRAGDVVARLGGDEFVVLLEGLGDLEGGQVVARRVLAELARPFTAGDQTLFLNASIGIAACDGSSERTASDLLRDGDTAMYVAKQKGKGRFEVFEPEMHDRVVAEAQITRDLRHAAADGQLRLLFQPQVDVGTGAITGVEALVRWQHPRRGLLTPDVFIPAAESTGDIVAIDDWVLQTACAQLAAWDASGRPPLEMAVNVSARRLMTGDLARTVADTLATHGVDAHRLELELTETVAVEHDADAVDVIGRVRALGVRVAIDDFGMGHSALSRLQTFPVDRLKIDRSFVAPLTLGAERGSLVDAMLAIGQSLGLSVVAEGVETAEHLEALRTLGCPSAQGYLFSRPVPADDIVELLGRPTVVPDPAGAAAAAPVASERLTRNLLSELQRVTGLESTYLTRIDWDGERQHITHAHNAGAMAIPEGLSVDWSDTVCRRALERGVSFTDDVPTMFADSDAAAELGLQTYISVPLRDDEGAVAGTLCGASTRPVALGDEALAVMTRFAELIAHGVGARAT